MPLRVLLLRRNQSHRHRVKTPPEIQAERRGNDDTRFATLVQLWTNTLPPSWFIHFSFIPHDKLSCRTKKYKKKRRCGARRTGRANITNQQWRTFLMSRVIVRYYPDNSRNVLRNKVTLLSAPFALRVPVTCKRLTGRRGSPSEHWDIGPLLAQRWANVYDISPTSGRCVMFEGCSVYIAAYY